MLRNDYQFVLMFFRREEQSPLAQVALTVDWEPAREWAEFEAIRRGALPASTRRFDARLEPIWHAKVKEPYVEGFRVVAVDEGARESATDFDTAYFKEFAAHVSSQFVERGELRAGEAFWYLTAAFPREREEQESKPRLNVEANGAGLSLRETSLPTLAAGVGTVGQMNGADMPVLISREVLDETAALSKEAGAKETGGILVGHLHRDPAGGEIFAEVTAQIHARSADAELTRLTFTPQTWTEVRAALNLRRRGEIMLGWWHSHPVREWCKDCSAESRKVCSMRLDFFSAHDRALHRAVFPRAYSVALVVNDFADSEHSFSMFGWRQGLLQTRGFQVKGDKMPAEAHDVETREFEISLTVAGD